MWRNMQRTKEEVLPLLKTAKSIIVFDTETTGLGSDAKIIQFSGIRYTIDEDLRLKKDVTMDLYINPEMPLPEKIIEITGITDEMLEYAKPEKDVFLKIAHFLYSADLWAAYNYSFDERMLIQMATRLRYNFPCRPSIDVLKMARDVFPGKTLENHKLQTVSQHMFPDLTVQYHSAIEDTNVTGMVLEQLIQHYTDYTERTEEKTQVYMEWASYNENPRQKSQKRIKLKLSVGEYGDIFWDVIKKCWDCKSTSKAKKLFESVDLSNLEQQLLNKYGWKYRVHDMEALAYEWGKAKRLKEKEAL